MVPSGDRGWGPALKDGQRYIFSVAAYVLAVAAGCAVAGTLVALVTYGTPLLVPVFGFAAVVCGLVPGALLFLPTVLLTIWLGNHLSLRSVYFAALFGALGAATTGMLLLLAAGGLGGVADVPVPGFTILAVAGAVAGKVYFLGERVDRLDRRSRLSTR